MKQYHSLHNYTHQDIQKRINFTTIGIACILIGIGAFLLTATSTTEKGSNLDIFRICAGSFCILAALYQLGFRSLHWVYLPTGSSIRKKSVCYNPYQQAELSKRLEAYLQTEKFPANDEKKPMKLDLLYTKDKSFASFQLFEYTSYLYTPASEICYLKDEQAKAFVEAFAHN